jgi:hypothetical protein
MEHKHGCPDGYTLRGVVSPDAGYALFGGGVIPKNEALRLIAK